MNRRTLLSRLAGGIVALCGMATATAKTVPLLKDHSYAAKCGYIRGLRHVLRVIVIEAEHPNVLSLYGEEKDIAVFHKAWQTDLWPGWETHENPAARNLLRMSSYHWQRHGRGLFQLGSQTFMAATAAAIEACRREGIDLVYREGFRNDFYQTNVKLSNTQYEAERLEATRTWLQAILSKRT